MHRNHIKAEDIGKSIDLFGLLVLMISMLHILQLRVKSDLVSVIGKFFLPAQSYQRVSKNMKDANPDELSTTAELEEIRIANMLDDIKNKVAGVDASLIEVAMFSNDMGKNVSDMSCTNEMQAIEDGIEKILAWDEEEKPDYVQELEDALNEIRFAGKKGFI